MPVLPSQPLRRRRRSPAKRCCRAFSGSYGLDTGRLRYFNIFGPRQNANSAYAAVIAAFAKALLAGQRPVIYGDGEQSRDFTFVHNAVHANLLAARSREAARRRGDQRRLRHAVTVNHLAELMSHALEPPRPARPPTSPSAPATSSTPSPTSPAPARCSATSRSSTSTRAWRRRSRGTARLWYASAPRRSRGKSASRRPCSRERWNVA